MKSARIDRLRASAFRCSFRAAVWSVSQRGLVGLELDPEVLDLSGEIGVALGHGIHELEPVRELAERRRAQQELDVGGRAVHEGLRGALVQTPRDLVVPRARLVQAGAGVQELGRERLEPAFRRIDLCRGDRQPGVDHGQLVPGVANLREQRIDLRVGALDVLLGRGGAGDRGRHGDRRDGPA